MPDIPKITIGDIGSLMERMKKIGWIESGGVATESVLYEVKYTDKGYERMKKVLDKMRSGDLCEIVDALRELYPPVVTMGEQRVFEALLWLFAEKHPGNKCVILPFPGSDEVPPKI